MSSILSIQVRPGCSTLGGDLNYPQYPGGYDPYPAPPPPHGATAIIAGVLAIVGSVGQALSDIFNIAFGVSGWGRSLAEIPTPFSGRMV
jgi:hypothetical protein